ncbi:hypothetical protein [Microbacterium resistens]|uniref:hypothetical protein n=1 Tax=Microbacterium resistens TaxID=156977 RepID=UPI00366E836B
MTPQDDQRAEDAARAAAHPLIHVDPDFYFPAQRESGARRFLRALRYLIPRTT